MSAIRNPHRTIILTFITYKFLLLAIAAGSLISPTYDTSSTLLLVSHGASSADITWWQSFLIRLNSWDAIYFTERARRPYVVEQEWAFGMGLPYTVSFLTQSLPRSPFSIPLAAVLLSHASHLLSSLTLYHLGLLIWRESTWALVASLLHIISPAGLFLSAPYAESTFSFLSFLGYYLLARSCYASGRSTGPRDVLWVVSGAVFGVATTFRANGLLNGVVFAVMFLVALWTFLLDPDRSSLRRVLSIGLGGVLLGLGYLIPQYLAYQEFCVGQGVDSELRSWCTKRLPSIYSFVQKEYWNTGFLKYYTLPNIPLFALAAPMFFILLKSGKDVLTEAILPGSRIGRGLHRSILIPANLDQDSLVAIVACMAVTQMLIALMTLTNYHVQIITRLSSGYPIWYWWLAACLRTPKTRRMGSGLVVFMIVYGCVQGALFASFLPPA